MRPLLFSLKLNYANMKRKIARKTDNKSMEIPMVHIKDRADRCEKRKNYTCENFDSGISLMSSNSCHSAAALSKGGKFLAKKEIKCLDKVCVRNTLTIEVCLEEFTATLAVSTYDKQIINGEKVGSKYLQ